MSNEQFMEELLAINCAYNFKEETRELKAGTTTKCFSTECMLTSDPIVANLIKERGCTIYKTEFVKVQIEKKNQNPDL